MCNFSFFFTCSRPIVFDSVYEIGAQFEIGSGARMRNRKEANQQLVFFYKIVNIYANFECSADAANQANHAKPVSLSFDPA